MITNYQKKITVNKLKKVYSELQQAIRLSVAENGDTPSWEYHEDNVSVESSAEFAQKYFLPYLKVLKFCATDTTGDCEFHAKFLNGNSADNHVSVSDATKIFLMNGCELLIENRVKAGNVFITADINGTEKPNIYGKDIFAMELYNGKFGFRWADTKRESLLNATGNSGCNQNARGLGCGSLIVTDKWTISKDYPW